MCRGLRDNHSGSEEGLSLIVRSRWIWNGIAAGIRCRALKLRAFRYRQSARLWLVWSDAPCAGARPDRQARGRTRRLCLKISKRPRVAWSRRPVPRRAISEWPSVRTEQARSYLPAAAQPGPHRERPGCSSCGSKRFAHEPGADLGALGHTWLGSSNLRTGFQRLEHYQNPHATASCSTTAGHRDSAANRLHTSAKTRVA